MSALSGLGRGENRPKKLLRNLRYEQLTGFTSASRYASFNPLATGIDQRILRQSVRETGGSPYQQLRDQQQRSARSDTVIELVRGVRLRPPRPGARKLHHLLKQPLHQAGASLGRDALLDVLREAHMLVQPKRAYHKTTDSHHPLRRHPNSLKEGPAQVRPSRCEQVWVADITYLPTDRDSSDSVW